MILEKATKGSPATAENTTLTKSYWGLDLGVQATGGSPATAASAGGVGGLLATFATKSNPATAGTETHYFHYDADGNVTETIDSNGDLTASYEYGPFGELISESWVYSTMNTYKFSTKPQDEETGYYYYGFRYYDSVNGRWLSRDSIGEIGGVNVYAFVRNNSVNLLDLLGQSPLVVIPAFIEATDPCISYPGKEKEEEESQKCYIECSKCGKANKPFHGEAKVKVTFRCTWSALGGRWSRNKAEVTEICNAECGDGWEEFSKKPEKLWSLGSIM